MAHSEEVREAGTTGLAESKAYGGNKIGSVHAYMLG